ncbi:MAG: hypothetical protein LBQ75_07885, partial [Zoogloeaceae bacterium]|nr:hypothetical protein [Zoogloeaceae bacterium]
MSRALPPRREGGAVLLLILLCLTFGALAWSFGMNPPQRRALATAEKLARAREALLGYAVLYPEARENRQGFVPGHLPCPDDNSLDNEGTEAGNCGSKGVSALGHFPWRSLGMPPQKDDAAECLWYLVSGNHKAGPKADLLNPDTTGLIEIVAADGKTVLAEQVVAVLFAPGAPLPGQTRRHNTSKGGKESECRRDYDASQYLDRIATIENDAPNPVAEGITRVLVSNHETVNDRLVWITRDEWAARLQARLPANTFFAEDAATDALMLTQRIAACLMRFGEANEYQRLPWATPLEQTGNAPETFHYSRMTDQKNRLAGRPPYSVYNSVKAIGASAFAIPEFKNCATASDLSCRWLIRERCPDFMRVDGRPDNGSYDSGTFNSHNGWWDKWKDHFFYLVAPDFAPAALNAGDCETMPDGCLRVAGVP